MTTRAPARGSGRIIIIIIIIIILLLIIIIIHGRACSRLGSESERSAATFACAAPSSAASVSTSAAKASGTYPRFSAARSTYD